jgi:hypothetical protein
LITSSPLSPLHSSQPSHTLTFNTFVQISFVFCQLHSVQTECSCFLCWWLSFCRGLEYLWACCSQLGLKTAHHLLDKSLDWLPRCLGPLLQPSALGQARRALCQYGSIVYYTNWHTQGHFGATTTSVRGIIFSTTWGVAMSSCIVWLKTLNLALMRGTPQSIRFFLLVFCLIFQYYFCVLFSRTKMVLLFKFGGVLWAMLVQTVLQFSGQLFPCSYTSGTVCKLSLGVWETLPHTLSPFFFLFLFFFF